MNDQQILEFVASKQPIRAVQISDKFDVDLKTASEALRALVEIGDLVRANGTSPNGQAAQVYGLSETFVKSREGKLMAARLDVAKDALAAAGLAAPAVAVSLAAESAAPAPIASASPSPADDTSLRRIERAIAHVKDKGPTSDVDMRLVLNLRSDQYPSSMLQRAVKDGRMAKDGKNWTLGSGVAPEPVKRQPAFGGSLGLPGAPSFPVAAPKAAAAIVTPTPAARTEHHKEQTMQSNSATATADQVSPAATGVPPTFRCGLWSDGVLELQRNGITVAELEQDEGETVAAFMARLRQPLETA